MQRPVTVCAFVSIVFAGGADGSSRATPMLEVGLGDSTPPGFGVGSALAFPVLQASCSQMISGQRSVSQTMQPAKPEPWPSGSR
jgi:hypothetical protein